MSRRRRIAGWIATASIVTVYLGMSVGYVPMRWFFAVSLVNSAVMTYHTWPIATRQMNLLTMIFAVMNLIGLARTVLR